jgi:hypothetical protein
MLLNILAVLRNIFCWDYISEKEHVNFELSFVY